jgi:hypothetical protein
MGGNSLTDLVKPVPLSLKALEKELGLLSLGLGAWPWGHTIEMDWKDYKSQMGT